MSEEIGAMRELLASIPRARLEMWVDIDALRAKIPPSWPEEDTEIFFSLVSKANTIVRVDAHVLESRCRLLIDSIESSIGLPAGTEAVASQWDAPLQQLRDALGQGGNDPQIRNAIGLVERAATYPARHLDMRLAGNGPTYREAVNEALATVTQKAINRRLAPNGCITTADQPGQTPAATGSGETSAPSDGL